MHVNVGGGGRFRAGWLALDVLVKFTEVLLEFSWLVFPYRIV